MINIIEQEFEDISLKLFKVLLMDRTTKKNICWATDSYIYLGSAYYPQEPITKDLVTGINNKIILPRIAKNADEQAKRRKEKAEVFTPSWVCNKQNNLIDEAWFGRKDVFNKSENKSWKANKDIIKFPKDKNWREYVDLRRLEVSCGEAPYLVSRYDTVTGREIPIEERIGLLDRKIRVINENTSTEDEWFYWIKRAYESIYGYEYQGDNLLIARKNLLYTFIENMEYKFSNKPNEEQLKDIARIISWNIWQMDGITMNVPYSERPRANTQLNIVNLLDNNEISDLKPVPCRIYDWRTNNSLEFKGMINGGDAGNMKFDAIVGNPPYQNNISSSDKNSSLSKQMFPAFIQQSILLGAEYVSLITPSRWFTANAQDKSFIKLREFIRDDHQHFDCIFHYPDNKDIFSGVEIAGGVNYFLYRHSHDGNVLFHECTNDKKDCISRPLFEDGLDIILSMNGFVNILNKVRTSTDFVSMMTITQGRNAFGIVGKYSELKKMSSDKTFDGAYELRCAHEEIRYTAKSNITKNIEIADKWKVFTSKGNGGAGILNSEKAVAIIGKAYIGKPQSVCTDSLIPIGCFDTIIEAVNRQTYMKTKCFRFMIGILKVSQNIYQNV